MTDPFPDSWSRDERDIFNELVGDEPELLDDARLQMDFHLALFDQELDAETRSYFYEDLISYLYDAYGIDFDTDFDWEAYREWYDNAA